MNQVRTNQWYRNTEKTLNQQSNIKFNNNHRIKTVDDVIYWAVGKREKTVFSIGGLTQCTGGRRRSAEDIYLLCKNYGISITLKEVDDLLSKLNKYYVNKTEWPFSPMLERGYCSVVDRVVHHRIWLGPDKKIIKTNFKELMTGVRNS